MQLKLLQSCQVCREVLVFCSAPLVEQEPMSSGQHTGLTCPGGLPWSVDLAACVTWSVSTLGSGICQLVHPANELNMCQLQVPDVMLAMQYADPPCIGIPPPGAGRATLLAADWPVGRVPLLCRCVCAASPGSGSNVSALSQL